MTEPTYPAQAWIPKVLLNLSNTPQKPAPFLSDIGKQIRQKSNALAEALLAQKALENSQQNHELSEQSLPIEIDLTATPLEVANIKLPITQTIELTADELISPTLSTTNQPTSNDTLTDNLESHSDNDTTNHTTNPHAITRPYRLTDTIGKLGAYVGNLTHSDGRFNQVDLSRPVRLETLQKQGGQLLGQLLGSKNLPAQKLAEKLLPEQTQQQASDWLYKKIANLAERWALAELGRDERFGRLNMMSLAEKEQFLQELHDQTRGFAVLGGVAGLFGLKGVILDTAWLLLVSLKSIYQTAIIADVPLTGEDSTKLAYGILAGANLDKMQEKQVLMTGLALGKTALQNTQSTGLIFELGQLSEKYHLTNSEQLASVATFLDRFNTKLVQRLLPIGSSLIAGYYNSHLIDEILGVAKASLWENQDIARLNEPTHFWHSRPLGEEENP